VRDAAHGTAYIGMMSDRLDQIPNRRAIIDRRALAVALDELPGSGTALRQVDAAAALTNLVPPALTCR
jgi:hypothetical protein